MIDACFQRKTIHQTSWMHRRHEKWCKKESEARQTDDWDESSLDIEPAIGRMKSEKAAGIDGKTTALNLRRNIRLFKNKGDTKDCGNYGGISLLQVVSKAFSWVILNQIQKTLTWHRNDDTQGRALATNLIQLVGDIKAATTLSTVPND